MSVLEGQAYRRNHSEIYLSAHCRMPTYVYLFLLKSSFSHRSNIAKCKISNEQEKICIKKDSNQSNAEGSWICVNEKKKS